MIAKKRVKEERYNEVFVPPKLSQLITRFHCILHILRCIARSISVVIVSRNSVPTLTILTHLFSPIDLAEN